MFVREIFGTRRKDVIRLIITEGPRFPKLAEFYYHEVIERVTAAMRALLKRAVARGELASDALARFPQLLVAPALVAIVWNGLFDRFAPLDVRALHARPYRSSVRRKERAMSVRVVAIASRSLRRSWHRRVATKPSRNGLPGLGRGRPDLRQPRRGRPRRDACGARGRSRSRRGRRCSRWTADLQQADVAMQEAR